MGKRQYARQQPVRIPRDQNIWLAQERPLAPELWDITRHTIELCDLGVAKQVGDPSGPHGQALFPDTALLLAALHGHSRSHERWAACGDHYTVRVHATGEASRQESTCEGRTCGGRHGLHARAPPNRNRRLERAQAFSGSKMTDGATYLVVLLVVRIGEDLQQWTVGLHTPGGPLKRRLVLRFDLFPTGQ